MTHTHTHTHTKHCNYLPGPFCATPSSSASCSSAFQGLLARGPAFFRARAELRATARGALGRQRERYLSLRFTFERSSSWGGGVIGWWGDGVMG
jgi:hypothetical protein